MDIELKTAEKGLVILKNDWPNLFTSVSSTFHTLKPLTRSPASNIANALHTDVGSFLVDSLPAAKSDILAGRLMEMVSAFQPDEFELIIKVIEPIRDYLYPREIE